MIKLTGAEELMIPILGSAHDWISLADTRTIKLTASSSGTFSLYLTSRYNPPSQHGHNQVAKHREDEALLLDKLNYSPSPKSGDPDEYRWMRYQPSIRATRDKARGLLASIGFNPAILDEATRDRSLPDYVEQTVAEQKLHAGILHKEGRRQLVFFTAIPTKNMECNTETGGEVEHRVYIVDRVRLVDRVYSGRRVKEIEWEFDREKPGVWWWSSRFADRLEWCQSTETILRMAVKNMGFDESMVSLAFREDEKT